MESRTTHQLAGGSSGQCPKLEVWTTHLAVAPRLVQSTDHLRQQRLLHTRRRRRKWREKSRRREEEQKEVEDEE